MTGRLRLVAGWGLLSGAIGIFIDAWASWSLDADSPDWLVSVVAPGGLDNGSIGLVPTYLGGTVGLVALVLLAHRHQGLAMAALTSIGVAGTFVFWFSYPARATYGGLGSIVLGVVVLALPSWGRLASPFWIASGVMGIPELVRPGINWGPVASFTLLGAAIAVTGAHVLWGTRESAVATRPFAAATPASVSRARSG